MSFVGACYHPLLWALVRELGPPQFSGAAAQVINDKARLAGTDLPFSANTPYLNTISLDKEERSKISAEDQAKMKEAGIAGGQRKKKAE